jgi:hypothetical protein
MDPEALERSLLALEARVQALEATVANPKETRPIEPGPSDPPPTPVERPASEPPAVTPPPLEPRVEPEPILAVPPHIPIAAFAVVAEAITARPLPPAAKTLLNTAAQPGTFKQVVRSSWLALDMVHEIVAIGRMLVDPRYHTAWITRFVVIGFALAILLSNFWVPFSSIGWIGWIIDKVADLLLAGVLFLALFCEARRYKEWRAGNPRQ